MSDTINKYIEDNNIFFAIQECKNKGLYSLGKILDEVKNIYNSPMSLIEKSSIINVKLYCNWMSSKDLCNLWNKMSKGNYTWNNIRICWEGNYDYQVVVNSPLPQDEKKIQKEKTIVFRMEPYMESNPKWGWWSDPNPKQFLSFNSHFLTFNNCEWHLSKTYNELMTEKISKDINKSNIISSILSSKYTDPGHKKRIDFIKFLDTKDDIFTEIYGENVDYKNFKGSLPPYKKEGGLLPYKYTFNVENNQINNYFTEKLLDAILSECLIFYNGPKNIRDYIDERAFVWLDLTDFEYDYTLVKKVIEEDWWFDRLPYIRKEKLKILNEYQFFPRIEKIINSVKDEASYQL